MSSIYGPQNWNSREAAEVGLENLDLEGVVAHGNELWARLGVEPHADEFWDIVAPLVHALAAEGAENAGYGSGFSAATACEQLMHEIALGNRSRDRPAHRNHGSVPTKVRGATSLIAYMTDVNRFLTFLHLPNEVVL